MAEPAKPFTRRSALTASTTAFSVLALAAILLSPPRPLLVWNASASSPVGFYGVQPGRAPDKGEMVVAWLPPKARQIASSRNYLSARAPLLKPVVAVSGARICAKRSTIFVNGRIAAVRRGHDPSGRPMPWWSGCKRLGKGDVFLLAADANSFDGRYFGATRAGEVIGRARLLWRR